MCIINNNSKFERDLKQGSYYENETLKYLEYDEYEITEGYFKEYDIIIKKDNIYTKIEVKSDRLSSKTQNLCIEYSYKGFDSGINTTKADYYYYYVLYCKDNNIYNDVIKYELYKLPVKKLKKIIKKCRSVKGGDNKNSSLYLLPLDKCYKYLIKTHYINE